MRAARSRNAAYRRPAMKTVLRVDPIACDGHGLCAELVPESVRLDDWGYPIVIGPVPIDPLVHAHRAVRE